MDVSQLPQLETDQVMGLATTVNQDGFLVFGKSTSLATKVYKEGDELTAPFSQTPCATYSVEVSYNTPSETVFIGGKESGDTFFTAVNGSLVRVSLAYIDSDFSLEQTYPSASAPESVKAALASLGWLDEANAHPSFTIKEKILSPNKVYSLQIKRNQFVLPPTTPGAAPTPQVSYEFHFKNGI